MRRDTWIQIAAAGVLAACVGSSFFLTSAIAASAGRARLAVTDRAEEGDPPQVAMGIMMGAFRGLFVNMLWIRANDLKEEGKYYEAVDLASAITKLQPRFPRVWAFHAWNLAYNISVATQTEEERWDWVQKGINLLREQGIPANPNDLLIHRELAWIYLHKVSGVMDDASNYYQRRHAREWTIVMGQPRPPAKIAPSVTGDAAAPEEAVRTPLEYALKKLADITGAPDTLEGVYAREAEAAAARGVAPVARELVARLKAEAGLDPNERVLEQVELYRGVKRVQGSIKVTIMPPEAKPAAFALIDDPRYLRAWDVLGPHMQKRLLIDKYHMEPERMVRYTQKYGPLDWRCPAAHSVYWAARGVEEGMRRLTEANRQDFDFINTDRIVNQALQDLSRKGDLYYDLLNPDVYMALPNLDFVEPYVRNVEEIADREQFLMHGKYDAKARTYTLYAAGLQNLLLDVMRLYFRRGDLERAEYWRDWLRNWPGLNQNDPMLYEKLARPMSDIVVSEVRDEERFSVPDVARGEVWSSLQSAFLSGLLSGNGKLFRAQMDYARSFHKMYTEKQIFNTNVNRDSGRARMEVMDRDFDTFAGEFLARMVLQAGLPDGAIIYGRAPDELKAKAYPLIATSGLREQLDAASPAGGGGDGPETGLFGLWFQPPPGMPAAPPPRHKPTPERLKADQN